MNGDTEVEEGVARTEVLAKAFNEAAGGFFERWKGYEDSIREAEERRERMRWVGIVGAVIGLALAVIGVVVETVALSGVGVLAAIGLGGYAYMQYQEAEEEIEKNEEMIKRNQPDGSVSFVSKVHVPFYLVPYERSSYMIFDGLGSASPTSIQLSNIDGDALEERSDDLSEVKGIYDEYVSDAGVVDPEFAEKVSPNVSEHRVIEYPIVDQMNKMSEIASNPDVTEVEASVHYNNAKSKSVKGLLEGGVCKTDDGAKTVETELSMSECEEVINQIKGVEERAVSGDILNRAKRHREKIREISEEIEAKIGGNRKVVDDHYSEYADTSESLAQKAVCADCLDERVSEVADELNLVDQVLGAETGSFGAALNDEDIDEVDTEFRRRIRDEISEELPQLEGGLLDSYNRLEDLHDGVCDKHGDAETVRVSDVGDLFGEVWRSMYCSYRGPILDKAEDLEKEAEDIRDSKEKKMIDLSQYEQIKDSYEREYESVKSEYDAARRVEETLDGTGRR